MKTGWREFKGRLDASLWPLPLAATVLGAALGIALPLLDGAGTAHAALDRIPGLSDVLDTESSSATSILTGIAGALATILSVLFSITIVALQLASSQYTRGYSAGSGVTGSRKPCWPSSWARWCWWWWPCPPCPRTSPRA